MQMANARNWTTVKVEDKGRQNEYYCSFKMPYEFPEKLHCNPTKLITHNSLQNIPKQLSALAVSKAYAVDLSPQLCFKTAGQNENNRLVPCKYKCYTMKDSNIKNCILGKSNRILELQ